MPDFSEEEVTLMCLYHTGTRQGLIRELNDMLPYLAVDEMELPAHNGIRSAKAGRNDRQSVCCLLLRMDARNLKETEEI